MVSVIIPAYNSGQCIGRAIESVLAQSYSDYEIVVVNDGSTDRTAEVVRQYGNMVHYIYQRNAGVAIARNVGIAAAKRRWIAFLDADDEWLPNKLKAQMDLLVRNPDLSWCASNRYQSDGRHQAVVVNFEAVKKALAGRDSFENYFTAAVSRVCNIQTSTVVVRKRIFAQLGGFEPFRAQGEDFDMWIRIAHHFPRTGYVAEPLAVIHLDFANIKFAKRRIQSKRGTDGRAIIARHLEIAGQLGTQLEFEPFASMLLRKGLVTTIYHGFKVDARVTIRQFAEFFPWYWRIGTYLLTVFPKPTSMFAHAVAYLRYRLGYEKQVSRRWILSNQSRENTLRQETPPK
jgi:glycosyltransferase involved in cell wall biosynthesis